IKIQHNKQENVVKRKMEEAFVVNKRFKGALEMQEKAMQRQEKKVNSEEEIKTWIAQEMEVLMTTVEPNYSLEKLMQDRASLIYQLEQLKKNNDPDEKKLAIVTEFIESRNIQIADLQQKILEACSYPLYNIHYSEKRKRKAQTNGSSCAHTATYYACMYIYTHGVIHCGGIDNLEKATLGARSVTTLTESAEVYLVSSGDDWS
ncbi:Chromosome-associated kinesin KIF4, partial [Trachymyrmex cornetzi]